MVSRIELERKAAIVGLTGFRFGADGSMLLEFDLTLVRPACGMQAESPVKDEEAAPKALVAVCHSTSLALPTSPHAR